MNLRQIDLNLLCVLKQLLEEKHVTNTALTLSISQPTVSRSLNKLRKLFDDPLLVRSNTGYELTPKAEFIKQELSQVLNHLEKLLDGQHFDPESSDKTVKIFGLVPQIELLAAQLVQRIRQQAPNMSVDIDTIPKPHFAALISGDVHFVISALQPPTSEQNLYMMPLYEQDFRLLMSTEHPLADKQLTVENLSLCQFGQLSLQGDKQLTIESYFKKLANYRKISAPIKLNSFASAASIAEITDIIFHMPTNYAQSACHKYKLVARRLPDELQNKKCITTSLYWHKRHHNDPMCVWVRSLIKDISFT